MQRTGAAPAYRDTIFLTAMATAIGNTAGYQ